MNKEISEKTIQSETNNSNSDIEILSIDYFYKLHLKEKKSYDPSLFAISKNTRSKKARKVTLIEYKKIISSYLRVYFFELYLNRKTMYFFLTGFMKIVVSSNWTSVQRRGYSKEKTFHVSNKPFLLFWYMRPTKKIFHMVTIKKLTGLFNMIPKIEKIFMANYSKDLLPIFTEEKKKGKANKTLYRCIHP